MGVTARLKNSIAENLVRRTPGIYAGLTGVIRRSETMSLEERRALRDELTAKTLRQAAATPYAKRMGLGGSFDQWPMLEKEVLRREGLACTAPTLIPAHAASTGGTTGIPILLKRSLESVVFEQAILDHLVDRHAGLKLKTARVAVLRGDVIKSPDHMAPPHWRLRHAGLHLVCSSFHLNASTIGAYIDSIREFRPDVLWVYPSSLEAFVRLGGEQLAHEGLPGLKLVLASSEVLDQSIDSEAARVLRAPVLNFYGQSERVCASWAITGDEHYFLPAYGRVELVPAHDDADFSFYEVIGTSYWNAAQPLVRFNTGDLAKLPRGLSNEQLEAVTLGMLPFLGIEGRRSEYIVSPEGGHLIGMNHIPRDVPGIAQMQIVQRQTSDVEIHVVPLPDFGQASIDVILANARQKIPASVDIDIKKVTSLTRTKQGKAPLVMRMID